MDLNLNFHKMVPYNMKIDVEGILFTPITEETVSFDIIVGEASRSTNKSILKKKVAVV